MSGQPDVRFRVLSASLLMDLCFQQKTRFTVNEVMKQSGINHRFRWIIDPFSIRHIQSLEGAKWGTNMEPSAWSTHMGPDLPEVNKINVPSRFSMCTDYA